MMVMRVFILILLVACSVATAAEVYRWVDEEGETHYSDRPHENAEKVTLPKAQTFSAPAPQQRTRGSDAAKDEQGDKKENASYRSVKIVSPKSGEVLWNTGGLMKVSVSTQPRLRRGHTLMVYLDGRRVGDLAGNKREIELNEIFRGEHALHAEVHDADGSVVEKGDAVTFTVQQTSIQNPNNPNVPGPTPF
jgi:hypothetical protein